MARKTTRVAREAIEAYKNSLQFFELVWKTCSKCPKDTLFQGVSLDWWEGWIEGQKAATSELLQRENCYHGFCYLNSAGEFLYPIYNELSEYVPEFRSYRIKFHIKE